MIDMKPCPFCGEPAEQQIEDNGAGCFWIICDNIKDGCGCEGPYKHSQEDAVAAWNRRTQAPAANTLPPATAEAQIAFTLSDASRLLRKQDVQGACPHPNDCFHETDRVRCGPCAVKASAAKGVEIDDTHSHLPEVCRLRRELKAAAARIAELESEAALSLSQIGEEGK